MRRRSSRNIKKSAVDKTQDATNSSNDENSSKNLTEPDNGVENQSTKQNTNSDKGGEKCQISTELENPLDVSNNSITDHSVEEKDSEDQRQAENKGKKKNKGKSKGKNSANVDPSSNSKPEIENDNVQGIPKSPLKDFHENIQNPSENVETNPAGNQEVSEGSSVEETKNNLNNDNLNETNFDSAYVQDSDISKEDPIGETQSNTESTNEDKTSDSSEVKNDTNTKSTVVDRSQSDDTEMEQTEEKKRITLRRIPPKSTQDLDVSRKSSQDEDKEEPSEKIIPKDSTVDEKTLTTEDKRENSESTIPCLKSSTSEEKHEKRRRISSQSMDKETVSEDANKVFKKVKLIRHFSHEIHHDNSKKTRRNMWGKSDWLNNLSATLYKVDVDSIKIMCPTIEFLNESEVKLHLMPRERLKSETESTRRKLSIDKSESEAETMERQISEESTEEQQTESNANIIALNRKISIVDDTASKLKPPPSPAKNPRSEILYVTNLVRPFTVKQLKELLERTGKIREDGFWTDRIKSKCYVHYETEEEAETTRNALHGVFWPIGNGKQLVIDYATVEDMERAKKPVPVPVVPAVPEKIPEKENMEPDKLDNRHRDHDREEKAKDSTVRDWNKGREETHRRHSRSRSLSRSRERVRKHSRRSYTPEITKKRPKKEEPVPQKLMDDLFLKTKATPSIYWQPLSPEEIAMKQQQRLVRMEQHKKRIEETRGRLRDSRRAPFRRR